MWRISKLARWDCEAVDRVWFYGWRSYTRLPRAPPRRIFDFSRDAESTEREQAATVSLPHRGLSHREEWASHPPAPGSAAAHLRLRPGPAQDKFFGFLCWFFWGGWYSGLLGPPTAGLLTGRRGDILDNGSLKSMNELEWRRRIGNAVPSFVYRVLAAKILHSCR